MPTTSRTYQGRYAAHTYGRFAEDASRAVADGWVPVSLQWRDDIELDVVFERPTPVEVREDVSRQDHRRSLLAYWEELPGFLHLILRPTMYMIGAAIAGLLVALFVTTALPG